MNSQLLLLPVLQYYWGLGPYYYYYYYYCYYYCYCFLLY